MQAKTPQRYARWIGVLYVVTIISAGWGEAHVPNVLLVADDVAGTARKVAGSVGLFRAIFLAYLLEVRQTGPTSHNGVYQALSTPHRT